MNGPRPAFQFVLPNLRRPERERPPTPGKAPRTALRVLGIGFAVFVVWALFAPLNKGVLGQGRIDTAGRRVVLQHEDGGLVSRVAVQAGQSVHKGDLILQLDPSQLQLSVAAEKQQVQSLLAERAALTGELTGRPIDWPAELKAQASDPAVAALMTREAAAASARSALLSAKVGVLQSQQAEAAATATGLQAQIDSAQTETRSVKAEYEIINKLYKDGLAPRSRVYPMERAIAEMDGQVAKLQATLVQTRQSQASLGRQIVEARATATATAAARLAEIEATLAPLREKLASESLRLARTSIVSPVDGMVLTLPSATVGGAIRAGEPIAEIVPDQRLVVRGRIKPRDIERVKPGQTATIRLTGLNPQTAPKLKGQVISVSPDVLTDPKSEEAYYEVVVEAEATPQKLRGLRLTPGMPAEIVVDAGGRSAAAYLFEPLVNAYHGSFLE